MLVFSKDYKKGTKQHQETSKKHKHDDEAVMPGVKTGMCWYNIWSEPTAQTCMLHASHQRRNEPEKAILSGEFAVFLVCALEFICLRIFLCTYVCM